jgi:hypothetical protein
MARQPPVGQGSTGGTTAPSGPGLNRGRDSPQWARAQHCRGFTITLRHATICRNPLDEGSARRRGLCLTKHNTHNRQTSMPPPEFEPTIPTSERPQTHTLDRAATRTGTLSNTGAGHNSVLPYTADLFFIHLPSELPVPQFPIDTKLTKFSHSNYSALPTVPSPPPPNSCSTSRLRLLWDMTP